MPTIVPDDFHEQLLTLLPETRRWMSTYFTGSNKDLVNTLTFYSPQNAYKDCNIILVPGIATNTDIDPLMQLISYYALTHRYNLFCVNTFINRFKRIISPNSQPTQIWQDYTDSLNIALEQITYTSKQTYSCLIGHSAGATGIISTLNKAVDNNQTYHISRVLLFAPFVNDSWYQTLKTFSQRNHNNMDTIFLSNIFNTKQPKTYVPIQEAFLNSLAQQPFEPKKWGNGEQK